MVVLVSLNKYPFFQCSILTIFSTISFMYEFVTKPMLSRSQNILGLYNELSILICCYILTLMLNTINDEQKGNLGWALIGDILLCAAINLGRMLLQSLMMIYPWFKAKRQ